VNRSGWRLGLPGACAWLPQATGCYEEDRPARRPAPQWSPWYRPA